MNDIASIRKTCGRASGCGFADNLQKV